MSEFYLSRKWDFDKLFETRVENNALPVHLLREISSPSQRQLTVICKLVPWIHRYLPCPASGSASLLLRLRVLVPVFRSGSSGDVSAF